jgi:hypothetical protein
MHAPQAAPEIAAAAVDVLARVLDTFDQREAASVVREAASAAREAASAIAGGPVSTATLTESVVATLAQALNASGLGAAATWPELLAPALQAWIAQAALRPLAGSGIEGTADLS